MRKVMTLVGIRPELIKMSRVIAELDGGLTTSLCIPGKTTISN